MFESRCWPADWWHHPWPARHLSLPGASARNPGSWLYRQTPSKLGAPLGDPWHKSQTGFRVPRLPQAGYSAWGLWAYWLGTPPGPHKLGAPLAASSQEGLKAPKDLPGWILRLGSWA